MKLMLAVLLAAALLKPSGAGALTLQEAREEALKVNLKVRLYQEKVLEASSIRHGRYSDFFAKLDSRAFASHREPEPHINLTKGEYGTFPSTGDIPSEDRVVLQGEQDTYGVAVKLEQPVFEGGRKYYTYQQAIAHEETASTDGRQTAQDILFTTETAYIDLLNAAELKKMARQHLKTLEAHLADMQLMYDNGRASLNDLLKVKVELASAEEGVITAENDYLIAAGKLNTILSRPYDEPIEAEPLAAVTALEVTVSDADRAAMLNRPDIQSAQGRRRQALYGTKVNEADYYPGVKFVTEYIHQTEQPTVENDEWSIAMLLEYRIWDWGMRSHNVDAAKSVERQKQIELLDLQNGALSEVREAVLNIRAADKRLEVANEALKQAEENLRVVTYGFDHGAKTSTDVLDAEDLKTQTAVTHIQALYDGHRARAGLRHATGLMDREDIESALKGGE